MSTVVRQAEPADIDAIADVLADAFGDYAWTRWTVDADDHVARIRSLQRMAVERFGLAFGSVWVAEVDGRTECAAVWMDSAVAVPSDVDHALAPHVAELEGNRHDASIAAEALVARWRPESRHAFLATVGTRATMQRRGLAASVLTAQLTTLDSDGIDAFLETSSASNVAFYERLGFAVIDHLTIPNGGPDVWAMLRRPSA